MKTILQFLTTPLFTILFLCFTLSVFIYHTLYYHFIIDDYYYLALGTKYNFTENIQFLYKYANGRWLSNTLTPLIFGWLQCKPYNYWPVQLTQFFLFIAAVSFFFNSCIQYLGSKKLNIARSLHLGAFFTCLFYWFYFDARIEVWYWEASCLVHLISMMCIFLLYGIILRPRLSFSLKLLLTISLSLCVGGLSETFALACIILSAYLFIRNKKEKRNSAYLHLPVIAFVTLSLYINYLSPGTAIRTGYLPEPTVIEGLQNTGYTFYLHLLKVKHLPFKITGLLLLYPLSLTFLSYFTENARKGFRLKQFDYVIALILIFENTFMPAYSISQETPDRVFAFNWLIMLLLILNFITRKRNEIISS